MRRRKAFSLLEVVVVLVLLGVLATLAVTVGPSIVSGVKGDQAKTDLRALELSQLTNSQNRGYLLDAEGLADAEPGKKYTDTVASDVLISVKVAPDGQSVGMAKLSDKEECFLMKVYSADVNTKTATGTTGKENCSGSAALSVEGVKW